MRNLFDGIDFTPPRKEQHAILGLVAIPCSHMLTIRALFGDVL
jgi:hypothetical protein